MGGRDPVNLAGKDGLTDGHSGPTTRAGRPAEGPRNAFRTYQYSTPLLLILCESNRLLLQCAVSTTNTISSPAILNLCTLIEFPSPSARSGPTKNKKTKPI